jgi:hypothetical protein
VDADLEQRIADFVELERFDDGGDELHSVFRFSASGVFSRPSYAAKLVGCTA